MNGFFLVMVMLLSSVTLADIDVKPYGDDLRPQWFKDYDMPKSINCTFAMNHGSISRKISINPENLTATIDFGALVQRDRAKELFVKNGNSVTYELYNGHKLIFNRSGKIQWFESNISDEMGMIDCLAIL